MSIDDLQLSNNDSATTPSPEVKKHGDRGEIGQPTAGLIVWQKWKASKAPVSLKKFARQLVKDGDQTAQEWFSNKRGAKNEKRSEKNLQRIAAERQATKASKKGKK